MSRGGAPRIGRAREIHRLGPVLLAFWLALSAPSVGLAPGMPGTTSFLDAIHLVVPVLVALVGCLWAGRRSAAVAALVAIHAGAVASGGRPTVPARETLRLGPVAPAFWIAPAAPSAGLAPGMPGTASFLDELHPLFSVLVALLTGCLRAGCRSAAAVAALVAVHAGAASIGGRADRGAES